MNRREIIKAGLGSLAVASAGYPMIGPARAADWPTKSIRVVVPYAAGSATDLVPRTVFEQVGHQVGQSFVIENRPGGGTTVGSAQVSNPIRTATPSWFIRTPSSRCRRSSSTCPTTR